MNPRLPDELRNFARSLRVRQTDAEKLLWMLLRGRRLGFRFRRQHPVLHFILDFYCHEARLAVELDGGDHNADDGAAKDAHRSAELKQMGIDVIRFWDNDVLARTEAVLEQIYQELTDRAGPHPCPSPGGRGDSR